MCHPAQRVDRIAIWTDSRGQPVGVNIIHHEGSDHEVIEVFEPGPFDTLADVLACAERRLTREVPLW